MKETEKAIQKQGNEPGEELIVVGIGASAGGLEALRELLPNLPTRSNMAYVIAQHLDPKQRSMLTSLLSRYTPLEVTEIQDKQEVEANKVYITPPGKDVTIAHGRLHLSAPASAIGSKPSIDRFFASLAEDKGDKAVGIILSGTGSDGAHGMRAIKAECGVTIVQDEATAKYHGTTRAAMETGLIDLVLPPDRIGPELVELLKYPPVVPVVAPEEEPADSLQIIFHLLLEHTGCDFSDYKLSTIRRRIERRMAVHKLTELVDYVHYLEQSAAEGELLFKDILLSVTSFFRDPEAFQSLRDALARIIETKQPGDDIRIWVPGCATGEEAYSIAILLAEELGDRINSFNVQIFGTDIDVDAITGARRGVYPEAVVVDVDKTILDRYFTRENSTFQVTKSIREVVIFARQDLTRDPPFSRLDLVSCRNLLIYFNASLQKQLMPVFHHVLVPGGYLFLGKSETIGQFDDLFTPVNRKWKIYQRRGTFRAPPAQFGLPRPPSVLARQKPGEKEVRIKDVMNQAIADAYGHPAVTIDDRLEIVHVRGDVAPYLALSPGDAGLNILTMARSDEIRVDLRTLIHRATREGIPVRSDKLKVTIDEKARLVTLHVRLIPADVGAAGLTLVLFEEEEIADEGVVPEVTVKKGEVDPRVAELEHKLAASREHLRTTIEELETTNEELQSLNEELQSANEELQSSNEELETSNEELQSTNEELITVNEELQAKSAELAVAHADLENILRRVGVALVIVDQGLRVTRFTPPIKDIFALTAQDVGRALTTVACHVDLPNLRERLLGIIENEETSEEEVHADGKIYLMRILPYYSEHNRVAGAMLVFLDQTDVKRTELAIQEAREYAEDIINTVREPLVVLDADLRVISANRSFYQTFKVAHQEAEGQLFYDLGNRQWDIPGLRTLLEEILPRNSSFEDFEVEHDFETIGTRVMLLNARRVYREIGKTQIILLAIEDITERKRAEEVLQQAKDELEKEWKSGNRQAHLPGS
jgi:two-component system CheB/CheR fusion protein